MELLLGFSVAFLIGITGVGAGILTTPLLIVLLNMEPPTAVGTALLFSTITKGYAGILYFLKRLWDPNTLLLLCLGGVPGTVLGSIGVSYLSIDRSTIMLLLGLMVFFTSSINLYFYSRGLRPLRLEGRKLSILLPICSFFIGLEVGFSSVGAGVLVELLLLSTTELEVPKVIGTSLLFGFLVSLLGGGVHTLLGNPDFGVLAWLVAGGLIGVFLALKALNFLPQRKLRFALLCFLMLVGAALIGRGVER